VVVGQRKASMVWQRGCFPLRRTVLFRTGCCQVRGVVANCLLRGHWQLKSVQKCFCCLVANVTVRFTADKHRRILSHAVKHSFLQNDRQRSQQKNHINGAVQNSRPCRGPASVSVLLTSLAAPPCRRPFTRGLAQFLIFLSVCLRQDSEVTANLYTRYFVSGC